MFLGFDDDHTLCIDAGVCVCNAYLVHTMSQEKEAWTAIMFCMYVGHIECKKLIVV